MDLYIIRHAEAVAEGSGGPNDGDRPLTDLGHIQAKHLAESFAAHGLKVDAVLASPLVRAQQTAAPLAARWLERGEVETSDYLTPGFRARKLSKVLRNLGLRSVAIVGHEPDLSQYTAWLLGSKKVHIDFAKAGIIRLECETSLDKGSAVLTWMVPPLWYLPSEPTVEEVQEEKQSSN